MSDQVPKLQFAILNALQAFDPIDWPYVLSQHNADKVRTAIDGLRRAYADSRSAEQQTAVVPMKTPPHCPSCSCGQGPLTDCDMDEDESL